jgi:hypothetical protein
MLQIFTQCGFIVVTNYNRVNGAGLIRGDVLLNKQRHVEMYIGNGKDVKASSDEFGGIEGANSGDQTQAEIRIADYHDYPWDVVLRYSKQSEEYTGEVASFPTASEYALSGTLTNVEPDYQEIKCYMITLSRNAKSIDFESMKDLGVIGSAIEVGYLYDGSHMEVSYFMNPNLPEQVAMMKEANMSFAFYTIVRATNVKEANLELKWLRIYIQKYNPPLGVWLKLELNNNTAMNDMIVERYKTLLEASGLKGKIGFYVTREQLSRITWSKWQDDFLLWLVDHVDDTSEFEKILDPTFFDL